MSTQSELQSVQTATFVEGGAPVLLQHAQALMAQGQPFIVLTRSLPGAVFVRESLCPTRYLDEQGLPTLERNAGPVALFRAREQAGGRRALVSGLSRGERKGLVLTPEDLLRPGTLELLASTPSVWLVQDAQCLSVASLEFVAGYAVLLQGWQAGWLHHVRLFSTHLSPTVASTLQRLFRLPDLPTTSLQLPDNVELRFQAGPATLRERAGLTHVLQQHVRETGVQRGVWVLPSLGAHGVGLEELLSIANEVGLPAVSDPGEDVAVPAERHAELFHGPACLLLTADPAALSGRPVGEQLLCLQLQAPRGLEGVRSEVAELAARGGGRWVYAPVGVGVDGGTLSLAQLEQLARWIHAHLPSDAARFVIDAEGLQASLQADGLPLEVFAKALEQGLQLLWGAGFLTSVQRVRVQLKVAESHRFASPHIDVDPRYANLKARYDAALAQLGMMQAVRLRLSAQPAKDLRELAAVLGYSVAELNVLFEDLERDDLILCRLEEGGARTGNRSFELEVRRDPEALEQALACLAGRAEHEGHAQQLLSGLVGGSLTLEQALLQAQSGRLEPMPMERPRESLRPLPTELPVSPLVERAATPAGSAARPGPRLPASLGSSSNAVGLQWSGNLAEPEAFRSFLQQLANIQPRALKGWQPAETDGSSQVAQVVRALLVGELGEATERLKGMVTAAQPLPETFATLLLMLDYEGAVVAGETPKEPQALLLLPALEGADTVTLQARLTRVGFSGIVSLAEDGRLHLVDGGHAYKLVRRLLDPELEAQLWLALAQSERLSLPMGLVQARLSESYLMNEGQGNEALELALRQQLLKGATEASWGLAMRRALALGRVQLKAGDWETALEHVKPFVVQPTASVDVVMTAAEAWLLGEQALRALETLQAAGLSAQRGRAQGLYQQAIRLLQKQCEAQTGCDGCTLLGSAFCPVPEKFDSFVGANPFVENRKFLRQRVDKRAGHGFTPTDPKQLLGMLSAGGLTDEARTLEWMEPLIGGSAVTWLELARGLASQQHAKAAVLALKRAVGAGDGQASLLAACARGLLALGEQAESFAAGQQAEAAGWTSSERQAYVQELQARGITAGEGASPWLSGLLAEATRLKALQQAREQLQRALRHPQLREVRARTQTLEGLLGDQAGKEPLLREAQERIHEREQRLTRRLEQILKGPALPGIAQELEQLTKEAELLELGNLHAQLAATTTRMKTALERRAQERKAREERPEAGMNRERTAPPTVAASAASAHVGAPEATAAAAMPRALPAEGQRTSAEQARKPRREAPAGERTAQAAPASERRSVTEGASEQAGERPTGRRMEPNRGRPAESGWGGKPRTQAVVMPVLEGPALLEAVQKAGQDRERASLVMATLANGFEADAEKSMKLLRDVLPLFERPGALDAGLSRLIREKKIDVQHFGRLRRILDKAHGGANLNATYEELNRQEHPEAWKLVLGQLKLK